MNSILSHSTATILTRPADTTRRWRVAILLAVVLGLVELDLWVLRALPSEILRGLNYSALVVAVWRLRAHAPPPARPILGATRAWSDSTLVTLLFGSALVVAAWNVGPFHVSFGDSTTDCMRSIATKFVVVAAQQFALQSVLDAGVRQLLPSSTWSCLVAAALFGVTHLPNAPLVALTIVAGSAWIQLYRRGGRLAPLIASHFVLAVLAHAALPEEWIQDMRVGARFVEHVASRTIPHDSATKSLFEEVTSQEFYRNAGGTDSGFISALYREALGRSAAAEELTYWVGKFENHTRRDIARLVLASDEYRTKR